MEWIDGQMCEPVGEPYREYGSLWQEYIIIDDHGGEVGYTTILIKQGEPND